MLSRRDFLKNTGSAGALALLPAASIAGSMVAGGMIAGGDPLVKRDEIVGGHHPGRMLKETVSLDGDWQFRFDERAEWKTVTVPHTWQIDPERAVYFGTAWYRKEFEAPGDWDGAVIRVEFEAVYHSAKVWLNGTLVGEHLRKGYTAFWVDLTKMIAPGAVNTLLVMADNRFEDKMLPRSHSYDWAADGGITRPVSLHITAPTYIERAMITAVPDIETKIASLEIACMVQNGSGKVQHLELAYAVAEEKSGRMVARQAGQKIVLEAGRTGQLIFSPNSIHNPELWHFDHPSLYTAELFLYADGQLVHSHTSIFGIKKIEVKDAGFYLNGERVRLMGVERMAGSNPAYGMAETLDWIEHDHRDLKELNCVFTRVHWQQDKRVLDFCDRHGILIQLEIPTWGSATFDGSVLEPDPDIMRNGLEQFEEQVYREYNHPCIFSWGLCNEINGQNPPAYHFAENMLKAARKLDPHRLCSYASNSLQNTPGNDVARLMDFIEWNEYYESWYGGTTTDMEKNLDAIHAAFPGKPIVISEYGWCRCTPDRKAGDPHLVEILRTHDAVFRKHDYVGGLIFFCYNDYRTHIGDKGVGPLKQRIHGVVDLYGSRKASWEALRMESAPIASLDVSASPSGAGSSGAGASPSGVSAGEAQYVIAFKSRDAVPAYTLRGYTLRCIAYAEQGIPLEEISIGLPDVPPGESITRTVSFQTKNIEKVKVDILRPTGYSAMTGQTI